MIISEEELKQKLDLYQDKLSLKEIPIEIKITSNKVFQEIKLALPYD